MDVEGRVLSGVDEGIITEGEYLSEFASEEEIQDAFEQAYLVTQEDLIASIDRNIKRYTKAAEEASDQSAKLYASKAKLLEKLREKVDRMVLFDKLEPSWSYTYSIEESRVILELEHCANFEFTPEGYPLRTLIDQTFRLAEIKAQMLTVEEYANQCGVETGTVRQWIRRGKIRSAVKAGSEWRIPELAEPLKREYGLGQYRWEEDLTDIPEGFEFINEYRRVDFWKRKEDKSTYTISFGEGNGEHDFRAIKLKGQDKEKLELYFIGNPLVKYLSEVSETIVD